jgi:O-antigen ligase
MLSLRPPPPAPPTEVAAPPGRRARLAQGVALATILITPSLYSFHFMSFGDAKLAGLAVGAFLLVFVVPPEKVLRRDRIFLFAPVVALLVWAAAVAAARENTFFEGSGEGAGSAYGIVLLAVLLVLSAAPAQLIQKFIALSALPVAVLALAQYAGLLRGMFPVFPEYNQRMYSVFGNQDLLGGYLALGLVLGIALWLAGQASTVFVGGLFVTAAPALLLSGSRSAWLAAFVGGALAAWQWRTQWRKLAGASAATFVVIIAVLFAAPGATWDRVAGSFAASDVGYGIRLWIWDGTLHLIGQHPIAGVGLGNYAYHSPRALGEVLHERGPGVHLFNHIHTRHAHSDLLETAAETGLIGVAFVLAFILLIPRRNSPAWPALAAGFTFSLINTTLHSPPHLFVMAVLSGSLASAGGPELFRRPLRPLERRMYCAVLGLSVAGLTTFALGPSALHARAQAIYQTHGREAETAYRRAAYLGRSSPAAYELAILLVNEGQDQTAISMAEYAALGLDTGDLYYLRGYLAERRRPTAEAAGFYRECLLRWPDSLLAYKGLLRNTGSGEHAAILEEARRWLSPTDFAALTSAARREPPSR